jgi:nitroreductase
MRDADVNSTSTAPIDVLEALLRERYSVRAFKPEPVPAATIDRVLTAAQRTASWCNSQPWQVVIASGEARERFRKAIYTEAASGAPQDGDFEFPREYLGVYLERRREGGLCQTGAGELQFLRRAACRHHP